MKEKFKLKHLDILSETDKSKQDIATLMVDVLGYKNSILGKAKWFLKNFMKMRSIVDELGSIDYSETELRDDLFIKNPQTVDSISYLAMLNLQQAVSEEDEISYSNKIAKVIAIATFETNNSSNYMPDSNSYNNYERVILNQSLFDMIALYSWILEDVKKTSKDWTDRFFSVEVIDKDYDKHGGAGMSQFNVVNTVIGICSNFNVSEKDAWHISYSLVMSNNYSKAYSNWIQKNIQVSKEAEIRSKQKNNY